MKIDSYLHQSKENDKWKFTVLVQCPDEKERQKYMEQLTTHMTEAFQEFTWQVRREMVEIK